MPKPNHEWKVLPHGPLREIDPDIHVVEGEIPMPLLNLPRRMTIIRLVGGDLLIWSAISLEEEEMETIERRGRPAFLVVPSDHHRLDASAWKHRYPALQVVTPPGSRARTEKVVEIDSTAPDFGDPQVRMVVVPGTGEEEAALIVRRPGGTTLVLNDLVGNIRHSSGFGGWVLRMMGLAGDKAQVPKAVAMTIVESKKALGEQLQAWAAIPDLKRIIVSHGDIIEDAPQAVLRELATSLRE
jgi:hypothetical protein